MPDDRIRPLIGEVRRFAAVGIVNAAITPAAFYVLSHAMSPSLAFTIVYFCAIVLLSVITPRYVFRARPSMGLSIAVGVWYLVVYLVGLGVIRALEDADLGRWAVTLGTVAVTSPLSFTGTRLMAGRSAR